ncbi:hypothetical protein BV20DRAFT_311500 [Pilatotrama ljubarskyi]|nr:hypothetical protein BV20DRAFT_311500 [Pilatotrama ljubarskyi]
MPLSPTGAFKSCAGPAAAHEQSDSACASCIRFTYHPPLSVYVCAHHRPPCCASAQPAGTRASCISSSSRYVAGTNSVFLSCSEPSSRASSFRPAALPQSNTHSLYNGATESRHAFACRHSPNPAFPTSDFGAQSMAALHPPSGILTAPRLARPATPAQPRYPVAH